jgi:superfamily II DNA or RNA helicase
MPWRPDDRVIIRARAWRVMRTISFDDCEALDVVDDRLLAAQTFLLPFDRPRSVPGAKLRVVSRRRWAHTVSAIVRASFPYGGLRFCPRTIRLLPYQLEPALAVLRHGASRLLVADEVGLGKTVEAGLVVREVSMADRLSRVLILCPASLRAQWTHEMEELFELQVLQADAAWLRRAATEFPADVNPWSMPGVYLASIDFVKRPEALHPLEDVHWDLLVVDEAHAATPGSDRGVAVHALACRSRRVMLLTATPHSGDERQFAGLCDLGNTGSSPPLVVFNRSRAETPLRNIRPRNIVMSVRPTDAERRSHALLEHYTLRVWRESRKRGDHAGALVATVLRKRALSSAASLSISVRRRLQLVGSSTPEPAQLRLPIADEDPLDDGGPDTLLATRGLDDLAEEEEALAAIAQAAEAAAADESKIRLLLRLARRLREPAIVFSEYRDTAERIGRHLTSAGHAVCLLHGGLTPDERHRVVGIFASGRRFLVATDAASEGLNLHHSCRLVVHFELAWSASRMEQRCGRVNRIGQTRRVHEIALVADHTSERLVLLPLLRRAALSQTFSKTTMMRQLAESAVARQVFDDLSLETPPAARTAASLKTMNLREEAHDEARRLESLRRLDFARMAARTRPPATGSTIPITRLKRCASPDRTFDVLLGVCLRDTDGRVLEQAGVLVSFETEPTAWSRRAGQLRRQAAAAADRLKPSLDSVVRTIVDARLAAVEPVRRRALASLNDRDIGMRRERESAARQLVQAGLFDRRALRASDRLARARTAVHDDQRHRWMPPADPRVEAAYDIRAIRIGRRC